jgi:hypothetical protein
MYFGGDDGVASAVVVKEGSCSDITRASVDFADFARFLNELAALGMLRISSTKPRFLIRFAP